MLPVALIYTFGLIPNVRVGLGIASFMGLLSFFGSGVLLVFCGIELLTREDYDPLQPVTVMFVYWILCDLVQAVGTIFNFRWAFEGAVREGAYCRVQSVFEQIGDSGAALCVIIISVLVLLRVTTPSIMVAYPRQMSLALVAATSFILLFIILVPATTLDACCGNTDLWCWIVGRNGTTERLRVGTEFALMWAALAAETLVYGYLLLRKLAHHYHWFGITSSFDKITLKATIGMFWYAIAYAIELIPISVIRIRQFQHHNISHGWDTLAAVLFGAAGFVNAILFFSTSRRFGFADREQTRPGVNAADVKLETLPSDVGPPQPA